MDIVDFAKFVVTQLGGTVATKEQSEEFWKNRWEMAERHKAMKEAEAASQSKPKSSAGSIVPKEEIDLKQAVDDLLNTKEKGAEVDQAIIKEKINQPYDDAGSTWLHRAAQEGRKEEVERLLNNGADPKAKSKDGSTALHKAVQAASTATVYASDIVKLFLQKDINGDIVNAKNDTGQTPFHFAMCLGPSASDIVDQLMQHDTINLTVEDNERNTPLHVATSAAVNNIGNIEKLLKRTGLNVIDVRNKLGQSALELAIRNNRSKKIIKLLVKSGADVNAALRDGTGRHLIHLAAMDAQLDTIDVLHESEKLDIDIRDAQEFTAFHRVIEKWSMGSQVIKQNWLEKHSKLFRVLQNKADDIESKDIWKAVALDLLDKKAKINTQNHVGNTPLHTILETRSIENIKPIMQFLLDNKADKKISNQDNNTPLQYGVAWGVPIRVMKSLNSQYADTIVANNHGDTLLHYACSQRDNMQWVRCLLETFQLDPNRRNKATLSSYMIVKYLLKEMKSEESDRQYLEALSGILKEHQAAIGYIPVDRQPLLPLVLKSNYDNHRPLGWFKSPVQTVNYSAQTKFDFFSDTSATATDIETEGEAYSFVSTGRHY